MSSKTQNTIDSLFPERKKFFTEFYPQFKAMLIKHGFEITLDRDDDVQGELLVIRDKATMDISHYVVVKCWAKCKPYTFTACSNAGHLGLQPIIYSQIFETVEDIEQTILKNQVILRAMKAQRAKLG